jgi:hypothetical protein
MKNKILLGLFVAMFTMSMSAQNYSFFEKDVRFTDNSEVVTLTHFGEFQITENFGFTDYAQVQNSDDIANAYYGAYGQVLLGVYCKAIPNVTTSVYIGKETASNDTRMAGYVNYMTGDKLMAYAFYQRNIDESYDSEFWDVRVRYAPFSSEKNSIYIGARYMTCYGIGMPIGYRHSMSEKANVYFSYTTYYDCTVGVDDTDSARWIPTVSLNFEFL